MNDEKKQLSKARQALVDRVLSRLDAGAMPWDNGMSGFAAPRNAVTGKAYRGINLLALFCADKPDPRWMTFAQAKEQGYAVKQGAKGVPIEWYSYIDKRTNKPADVAAVIEETKDMTFDEKQRFKKDNLRTVVRGYHVFNASDIHGVEPYVAPPVDVGKRNERIENIIRSSEASIAYDGNGRNYYSPTSDSIHLTDRSAFKSDEFFYNTALHEMGHSTGHSSRLNRTLYGGRGSKEYAREELVAEISSVLTAAELGLDHSDRVIENSAEYVRSWATLIREDSQVLIDAAFDASHATDYICGKERRAEKTSEDKTQKENGTRETQNVRLHMTAAEAVMFNDFLDGWHDGMSERREIMDFGANRPTGEDFWKGLEMLGDVERSDMSFGVKYDRSRAHSFTIINEKSPVDAEQYRQAMRQDYPQDFADDALLDAADDFARHTPHYSDRVASPPKPTPQHNKPLVVNFYGGPGCGKTTAALELTAALKKAGYNVEYVSEFAKQLVLENKADLLKNQQYVTDGQYNLLDRIRNNADVIVTDSPVLLGLVYGKYNGISDEYAKKIRGYYDSFDNFNMFVERPVGSAFQKEGRVHDEAQSVRLDGEIKDMLAAQKVFYGSYKRDDIAKTVERIGTTYNRLYVSGEKKKTQKENKAPSPVKPHEFITHTEHIPDAMKALPNWIAFRTYEVFDKKEQKYKLKKTPLNPNKGASSSEYLKWAKCNEPETWTTFDKAVAFAKKYKLDGLAFSMSGSGMTCIDLDEKNFDKNGEPLELAQKFIAAADNTYMEKSVSGHGLHIFYSGARPKDRQNRNIPLDLEVYDSGRFISMTGNYNGCDEISAPSLELKNLLASNLPKLQQYAAPSAPLGMDDNALIEKIRSSKRGREFDELMGGADVCGDHSVSDFKLCNMLAFFSGGDAAQVERVFRSSGLYRPEKGDAYVKRTAEKACSTLTKRYSPQQRPNAAKDRSNGKGTGAGR